MVKGITCLQKIHLKLECINTKFGLVTRASIDIAWVKKLVGVRRSSENNAICKEQKEAKINTTVSISRGGN